MKSKSLLTALALLLVTSSAIAEVVRSGDWPADEKVTLSVAKLPRAEAIQRLAEKAGWSVVVEELPGSAVDVAVKDQPAVKVLEILLSDGRYSAKRDGKLVHIQKLADDAVVPAPAPAASAEPAPSAAPAEPAAKEAPEAKKGDARAHEDEDATETQSGEDRVVTGGSTRVESGETVHDLVVMGGSAEIAGTVTGDVVVMGGSAKALPGSHVKGDVTVFGGSFDVADGAKVQGKVDVIGGKARGKGGDLAVKLSGKDHPGSGGILGLLSDVGGAITRTALLFVLGTVFMALGTQRMESMQGEVAARPMRTFALGVVGTLVGAVALIALCVTVVGIPIALLAALLAVIGTYAGICAALTTLGAALFHHKSKSPYVHLAIGCVLFLIASSLPWIGGYITAGVVLFGFGALVATRGAGFLPRKTKDEGPYRTAAA
jgi:hypothetical protein